MQHHDVEAVARLHPLDQVMVDRDRADLVDEHGAVGELRLAQQAVEQRGLAAAEEAGQHVQRQAIHRLLRHPMVGYGARA